MPKGTGFYIAAGLLQGVGAGIVEEAKLRRQEALAALDRNFKAGLQQQEIASREKISTAEIESRDRATAAQRKDTQAYRDDLRSDREERRRMEQERLSLERRRVEAAENTSTANQEWSPADQRLWNTVKERHTTKDVTGSEETNWQAVADELRKRGKNEMADLAAPAGSATPTNFASPEDVGEALQEGRLSRSEAEKILREQFGYE